ncbi:MAG: hypothetical protein B7Y36_17210 [Novosphingobium sp. 28-62-57]|uniref:response regulator transcription factor n=1 Tax=Novosphingobium sp. 28-62-57 TaxID=1970409 RepID=UPI000BDCDA35|nr:helix-turn-helix transcriptional regulator [Novosphingobium sp. 28-62-57]OYZ08233.1 MAG: hypothetical protein B7Y36_17210 [Novosphingobium sp. 28-62-57]OYZ89830.1 MAG: hypothetical protein B7Y00_00865 [Sphingomonadales bacterium 17-56-6]
MEAEQKSQSSAESLSEKQREVLDLVVDRRTNKEIAAMLGISASAVEQRLQSARRKLGVDRRGDLARAYQRLLDTCANSTGGKFQVDQNVNEMEAVNQQEGPDSDGSDASRQHAEAGPAKGPPGRAGNGGQSVFAGVRTDRKGLILTTIDAGGALTGRLAAICVTATSLMMLVVIVTKY